MNHTITLTPRLNVAPAAPASAPTIGGTLQIKFLRWIEKTSSNVLLKTLMRFAGILLLAMSIFAPSFTIGFLTAAFRWNSYKIPIFCALLLTLLNAKRMHLFARRRRRTGNQHTFHGLAVGDLASFLKATGSWKRDEATHEFALTQGEYARIAAALKKHGLLYHGQNNAHVLRDIGQGHLVTQLRALADGKVPPLVFDPDREIWVERDGAHARWTLDREFSRRKVEEQTVRAEKKLERVKAQASTFATLFQ